MTALRQFLKRLPLLAAAYCAAGSASAWEIEMAPMTVQDTFVTPTWTRVNFVQPFPTPPLVFVLPTNQGSDPATLRIRNVTTTGFDVVATEPPANDGPHVAMQSAYLAVEPGSHRLPDGSRLTAVTRTTNSFVSRSIGSTWDTVIFSAPFTGTPAVLATIQTTRNESANPPATSSVPFLEAAVRNVTASSAQVALERAESTTGSITFTEDIGILAVEGGLDLSFVDSNNTSVRLQAVRSPNSIRGWDNGCFTVSYPSPFAGTPVAVASMNTRNGNNGGWLRRCSQSASVIGLTVDEDIDSDSERSHTNETAGIVAASNAFHVRFAVDVNVQKDVRPVSDPVNGTTNPKSIPAATVEYTIGVENNGSLSPDADTLTVVDTVPGELALCVTVACYAGGPVVLDTTGSPVPPGVTLQLVEYSNNGGVSFTYTPSPDADGFDSNINAVRVTLGGTFASIAVGGSPSFELRLAARIN